MSHEKRQKRIAKLQQAISERVLVLDGAMGTAIQNVDPSDEDFGGAIYNGCNEYLTLTKPKIIEQIHRDYLQAGADIIETNTFGGTALVLGEFDLAEKAHEINFAAAQMARRIADEVSTNEKPRFVAGSVGPTTKAITVTGGISFEALTEEFYQQAKSLFEGDVDYLLLETCQDTRNVKAGLLGIEKVFAEKSERIPIAVSCTIEPMGTMLAGQSVDAFATALEHVNLLYLGLNCATGPQFMTDHVRTLAEMCRTHVACVPNAGLPDEDGNYLETPQMMAAVLKEFLDHGWLNFVGGCCGTTPQHIRAFAKMVEGREPRTPVIRTVSTLSGIEYLEITEEKRPILVGERTNVVGSKKFKRVIAAGDYEGGSEVARAQVKKGAHIIDICMADPDRDEVDDIRKFMEKVIHKVKVPFMIDSTDAKVFEVALPYCQGKAILNSINLEDGEERFEQVAPLARRYGAAVVVGCIDEDPEDGMAVTKERKLAIARRSFDLLTKRFGIRAQDIYFDALVFPCATGDQKYVGSAPETIAGVKLISEQFPLCKTILGISNVSFGLPTAGREVLNAVFLYHCTKAGLDLAIVNSEKLQRYPSISQQEKELAENLIWNRTKDCIAQFSDHFRKARPKVSTSEKNALPLDQRLANYIIEGSKEGLVTDLNLALKKLKPLEIINGPLMAGMEEVGRLFNDNELIVAEVLQSAEAMKAAVAHLEPLMEKKSASLRGKVVLATVKGDVHDIGKNLVEIILKNNGFEVINLGIKVPPERLIAACKEHEPDIIGLSGLLVKSAHQMLVTAEDLRHAQIDLPILVGGAALSLNFVDKRIAQTYGGLVDYAKDAMAGLALAKKISKADDFAHLQKETRKRQQESIEKSSPSGQEKSSPAAKGNSVRRLTEFPSPPDFSRHVLSRVPLDHIWPFINPLMLYGNHLGVKGSVIKKMVKGERDDSDKALAKAWEIRSVLDELKEECRRGRMQPKAVYQFYRVSSKKNMISVFEGESVSQTFTFPRQRQGEGLCLADFVSPASSVETGDSLACFVVTAGEGIRAWAEELKEKGEYLKSHAIQALALETAEGFAEYLHEKIRSWWGFPDPQKLSMMERFQAKYRGCRFSFGYPACPDLGDQEKLFALLEPQEIGLTLTEGDMMDPEASVSAIVFHHPDAKYFSVGQSREA